MDLSCAHTGISHLHFGDKELQVCCQFNLELGNCHFYFRINIPDKNTVARLVKEKGMLNLRRHVQHQIRKKVHNGWSNDIFSTEATILHLRCSLQSDDNSLPSSSALLSSLGFVRALIIGQWELPT